MWRLLIMAVLLSSTLTSQAQAPDNTCTDDLTGSIPPRLQLDERGRVLAGVTLNVRPEPTVALARVGELRAGENFDVLAGPRCADGYAWWQIAAESITGWVAEGSIANAEYWLEPRGELIVVEGERFVETASGLLEPEGCLRPPDDYAQVELGYATLNQRTLAMLDQAQRIYDDENDGSVNFRQLITQGSYNPGGVSASFGTHDAGGAIDISVRSPEDFSVMRDEIPAMIRAMRIAGFAAWLRDTSELYPDSPIHIHAIAVGDEEASAIARQQISSDFGYFAGYNGLPPAEGDAPYPDRYGDPVLCAWMTELGFSRSDHS